MANIGELSVGIKVDESALRQMTKNVQTESKKAGDSLEKNIGGWANKGFAEADKAAQSFGKTLQTLGKSIIAFFALEKLFDFGRGIITLASNLQQAQISFSTMLGSAEMAGILLKQLSDFAKATPFELVGIRENAKQLLAMGVAQENIIPTLKSLGDVAAGLSVPLDRLALAYGQVLSKGRLQGQELLQFTEAGVPLLATLATNLGKTTAEISKMVENGQISAKDVTVAFETMSGAGGKFANLMEEQSKTVAGKFSNLKDTINSLGESIGSKFLPSLGTAIDGVLEVVTQYGDSVGVILMDTVSAVTEMFGAAFTGFGELFSLLAENNGKAIEDQLTFGQVVLSVFNFIIGAFQWVVTTIKAFGSFIGFVLGAIVANSGEVMDIFVGIFQSAFSQVANFGKVLGNNIAVGVQRGINKVIEWVNGLLEYLNKIPGISIEKFGKIAEGAYQEFSAIKNPFENIGAKSQAVFENIGSGFSDMSSGILADYQKVADGMGKRNDAIFKKTVDGAKKSWDEIKKINLDLIQSSGGWGEADKKAGAKKQLEEQGLAIKKLKEDYSELQKTKRELETADKKYHDMSIKRLADTKKALNEIGDKIKKNEADYKESLAKIAEESVKKSEQTTGDYVRDQAVKQAELEKSIALLDTQITQEKNLAALKGTQIDTETLAKQKALEQDIMEAKLKQSEQTSKTSQSERVILADRIANLQASLEALKNSKDFDENTKKLIDLQTQRNEQEQQLKDTKSNISNLSASEVTNAQALLEVERQRAALSEEKRAEFDYKQKIAQIAATRKAEEDAATAKFEADKKVLERQQQIYEFFQKRATFTPVQLNMLQKSEAFIGATGEEQNLMIKLANELIAVTRQKQQKAALEQELAREIQQLNEDTTNKAIANVQKLKKEYQDLIAEIQKVIVAQQQLEASKNIVKGFAEGGYTGDGGKHDVAGVVHKGEYVLSQDMLGKLPGIVPALESVRGGNTFDQSRSVSINGPINVSESLDFDMLLRRAKFNM